VPGERVAQGAALGVKVSDEDGREGPSDEGSTEAVELGEGRTGAHAEQEVGPQACTDFAHHGGGVDAAANNIAHNDGERAVADGNDVVPVTPDVGFGLPAM
jgi:hypothetical protein